jgi:hypothetical protein
MMTVRTARSRSVVANLAAYLAVAAVVVPESGVYAKPKPLSVKQRVAALEQRLQQLQLTPGPQGGKGDAGAQGLPGAKGNTGDQGLPGTALIVDAILGLPVDTPIVSVGAVQELTAPGIQLSNSGSALVAANLPCAGGVVSHGTSCGTSVKGSVGIIFDAPQDGTYEVCASFNVGLTDEAITVFRMEQTDDVGAVIQHGALLPTFAGVSAAVDIVTFAHYCEIFKFTAGPTTVRLEGRDHSPSSTVHGYVQRGSNVGFVVKMFD